jgi:cellulose synthase (UDP-forming)
MDSSHKAMKATESIFWQKSKVSEPSSYMRFILLVAIFGGIISALSLFDWWFRKLHIVNFYYFLLVSIFMWTGISRILLNWYQIARVKFYPSPSNTTQFSVAIFTTAAPGEPLSMFEKTFEALRQLSYPCTVYFLDGTGNAAYKKRSDAFGFKHMDLSHVDGAKAGKINEALKRTNEDIVLVLDPDHIVFPNFLDEVLPFFNDPKVGFVQVSQGYYNQSRSPVAQAAAEQSYLFYGPTQMYYGSNKKAVAIGANCVFRRKALESIDGHAKGLAEDLLTSMRLHAKGWDSIYHPVIVNRGLVPEDFDGFSKQQLKWARGLFEVLFEEYPKVFKALNLKSKIRYWFIGTFYLVGVRTLFFLLVPVFYFLFGWVAINMSFSEFLVRAIPFLVFSLVIYLLSQFYLVDRRSERGVYWKGMIMKFACWPVFTYAFLLTLMNKKIPYLPTSKKGSSELPFFFWPLVAYMVLLVLSFLFHYSNSFSNSKILNQITLQKQTLGMLSFSLLAFFQHVLAIFLILRSVKPHQTDAWENVAKIKH